jgi:hypothetical protein
MDTRRTLLFFYSRRHLKETDRHRLSEGWLFHRPRAGSMTCTEDRKIPRLLETAWRIDEDNLDTLDGLPPSAWPQFGTMRGSCRNGRGPCSVAASVDSHYLDRGNDARAGANRQSSCDEDRAMLHSCLLVLSFPFLLLASGDSKGEPAEGERQSIQEPAEGSWRSSDPSGTTSANGEEGGRFDKEEARLAFERIRASCSSCHVRIRDQPGARR